MTWPSYKRRMCLQACHFNGAEQYERLAVSKDDSRPAAERLAALQDCLRDSHGHNFEIEIECSVRHLDAQRFVVEDEKLVALVLKWDNTNLSVHPDFAGGRATTEAMAQVMAERVRRELLGWAADAVVRVSVWERPEICATFSAGPS